MTARVLPLLLLLLTSCGPGGFLMGMSSANSSRQSPVSATDGGVAVLVLTTCPIRQEGAELVSALIQSLVSYGTLVRADDGGVARLVLNACPFEARLIAAAEIERARGETLRQGLRREPRR